MCSPTVISVAGALATVATVPAGTSDDAVDTIPRMTATGNADDLDVLLAKHEILERIYQYCRGLDRMDRAMALATWHDDGTADYGEEMYVGTGAGFVDWVFPLHAQMAVHSHQITNWLISVDGDRAASEAYVTVTLLSKPELAIRQITSLGRYVDRWARRSGRWAIEHRRYLNDLTVSRELAADELLAMGSGRRDADDPSYANFATVS